MSAMAPSTALTRETPEPEMDAASPSVPRRFAGVIFAAPLVGGLVMTALPPFFPIMAQDFSVSVALLGQIMTIMLLLSGLSALVVGPLADILGFRRILALSICGAGVTLMWVGLAPVYGALVLASVIGGLSVTSVMSLPLALASRRYGPVNARRVMGWSTAGAGVPAVVIIPLMTVVSA